MANSPVYIHTLYDGAKTYFHSRDIDWFGIEEFNTTLAQLAKMPETTSTNAFDKIVFGRRYVSARRVLRLLWYLGFANVRFSEEPYYRVSSYKASSSGLEYSRHLENNPSAAAISLFRAVSKWWPMRFMMKYANSKQYLNFRMITDDLGGEMLHWTGMMNSFGFPGLRSAMRKPFNMFVTRHCLLPLATEVGLLTKSGPKYQITEAGREIANAGDPLQLDIVQSAPGEPLAYAAVCDSLVSQDEVLVISPWIDQTTVSRLSQGIEKTHHSVHLKILLRYPTRRNSERVYQAIHTIQKEFESSGNVIEVRSLPNRGSLTLHAKGVIGRSRSVITSANLVKTSLWRNLEVVAFHYTTPPELQVLGDNLWLNATPLDVPPKS